MFLCYKRNLDKENCSNLEWQSFTLECNLVNNFAQTTSISKETKINADK